MDEMLKDFIVEAIDLADSVEQNLLALEQNPADKEIINAVFRSFHTIKGGAGFMGLSAMVAACHLTENLFDALRNGSDPVTNNQIDVALKSNGFVMSQLKDLQEGLPADALEDLPEQLEKELSNAIHGQPTIVATSAVAHTTVNNEGVVNWQMYFDALLEAQFFIDDMGQNPVSAEVAHVAVAAQRAPTAKLSSGEARATGASKEDSIRIDAGKLDALLEIAGESVQAANQAYALIERLAEFEMTDKRADGLVKSLVETLGRATRYSSDLQKATLATRMQPVGRLFQKFPRLVRDLARDLGKDVDLVIEGAETEVDRVVVESLYDPIVHMLRNALDHGIEEEVDRRKSTKPRKAIISLKAWQEANSVMIELSDDGKGMDVRQIRTKAISKGLITDSVNLSDREIFNLVFLPGFSTKEVSTSVSGRGVGMDVVKTAVEKNRGTIEIDSVLGAGTKFSIKLPIELSIVPTMLVNSAGATLGVPMSLVQRVIEIPADTKSINGDPVVMDQGAALPVRSLGGSLGYSADKESAGIVVSASPPYILSVGAVEGVADLVIKPLTAIKVRGITGTARSAEGNLVLIVDPGYIFSGAK
jgi:two-component system chemotaxis sensor kinase CheA